MRDLEAGLVEIARISGAEARGATWKPWLNSRAIHRVLRVGSLKRSAPTDFFRNARRAGNGTRRCANPRFTRGNTTVVWSHPPVIQWPERPAADGRRFRSGNTLCGVPNCVM